MVYLSGPITIISKPEWSGHFGQYSLAKPQLGENASQGNPPMPPPPQEMRPYQGIINPRDPLRRPYFLDKRGHLRGKTKALRLSYSMFRKKHPISRGFIRPLHYNWWPGPTHLSNVLPTIDVWGTFLQGGLVCGWCWHHWNCWFKFQQKTHWKLLSLVFGPSYPWIHESGIVYFSY